MWKYVSRRIRDSLDRSVYHFDKRGTTGVVNAPGNLNEDKNKHTNAPCSWFTSRRCWSSSQGSSSNTNNDNKWNFEHLTTSWIGAITWSSMFVVGWYTSQLIHLKHKYHGKKSSLKLCTKLSSITYPYVSSVNKNAILSNSQSTIEKIVGQFAPTVHLVGNEKKSDKGGKISSSSSTNADSSDDILGEVLNSIENKLGMAAIDNGQLQDGLNLLRSAASRNYAPALYNLGLCYEMGLGVNTDEKMAMELYRSAAALEHPAALYNLGIYYGQGRGGLTRDTATATRLLRLAAVQGQQNAVDALKSLEADNEPLPKNDKDAWSYLYNRQLGLGVMDSIVPTPTTLFVENVNFSHGQRYEATLY